jgi:hypothetical protein
MATAKQVGHLIIACGPDARIWKIDMIDAYKNIPAAISDLRLQGFSWLGMYWVEVQQAFGARTAVAAFDRLGHCVAALALSISAVHHGYVLRTVDDVPVVTPAFSEAGPRFVEAYRSICASLNIALAPDCPKKEKAFSDSTVGMVLGILFDTVTLTWSLSDEKLDNILLAISGPLAGTSLQLSDMQHLMGTLNHFGQMCPFLKFFRLPLNMFLSDLLQDPEISLPMPAQAKADLRVWAAAVLSAAKGLPIPHSPRPTPLSPVVFVSDAAGARFVKVKGQHVPADTPDVRGAASVGLHDNGSIWFCCRLTWPQFLLLHAKDQLGRAYGCKSTFLELVGLIQPLLTIPDRLQGREVVFMVDNLAVVYGWANGYIKNDLSASVLIRALHIISAFLGCIVHIQHLPRMSTPAAKLADRLSRRNTTLLSDRALIAGCLQLDPSPVLMRWLKNPRLDWELPNLLLRSVQGLTTNHHMY